MNLNQLSHRSFVIDHVTIVDPKKNTSFGGHVVVLDGKIDAVTPGRAKDSRSRSTTAADSAGTWLRHSVHCANRASSTGTGGKGGSGGRGGFVGGVHALRIPPSTARWWNSSWAGEESPGWRGYPIRSHQGRKGEILSSTTGNRGSGRGRRHRRWRRFPPPKWRDVSWSTPRRSGFRSSSTART